MAGGSGATQRLVSNFEVVLAPEAESDITDALVWYRKRSVLAADGFRVEVFHAIDRIGEAPLRWPINEFGGRSPFVQRPAQATPDGMRPRQRQRDAHECGEASRVSRRRCGPRSVEGDAGSVERVDGG